MRFIYTLCILFYKFGILVASLFNKKAKEWVNGRSNLFDKLRITFSTSENPIWFHCASLGEYEQAKPLIEVFKTEIPNCKVITTFFSPSGYNFASRDNLSDYIFYLPIDTQKNARKFLEIVKPKAVFFVKYEFWYNFMNVLHSKNIPFFFICAIFREKQYFFKSYGKWFAKHLKMVNHFFVQNSISEKLLKKIGIETVSIFGDTRFDRVKRIADNEQKVDFMEHFAKNSKIIVAGSTWQPDEQLLSILLSKLDNFKIVVAPHEISRTNILKNTFSDFKTTTYSEMTIESLESNQVLIVDTIGLLSRLYRYSDISYVGGAFKTGLHNILEAAVYGKPLFFGPHFEHFNEAVELVSLKGAFSINSSEEMYDIVKDFENDSKEYQKTCEICENYVNRNLGTANKIFEHIKSQIK